MGTLALEFASPKAQNRHEHSDWSGMEPSDRALVEQAQAGDADAFERLFRRYTRMLESYVRRWLPPALQRKVSIADILQETRIVAFDGAPGFDLRDET
ncbi:MAG: RNA polymerase sigma factor, partial [Planctomycetota bacterium]